MTLYKNAEMEVFFPDTTVCHSYSCQVVLAGSSIKISYSHGSGYAIYSGTEDEPGHFRLTCNHPKGRATLHRFADDESLEGSYVEEGYEGMWRIELNEPQAT